MRGRTASALVLLSALAVVVSGCSEGSDDPRADPSAPMTEVTIACDRFAGTAQRITDAQSALYDGEDSPADDTAVDALVAELDGLKDGAPDDVSTALTDLGAGFRSAQRLLDHPSTENRTALVELAPKLSKDSQTVTTWIVGQCGQ